MLAVLCLTIVGVFYGIFPTKYAKYVEKYSNQFGVNKNLVYAVIRCESGFNPNAKSKKGAIGLMQLMPTTAKWCAELLSVDYEDDYLFQEEFNVMIGTYYISYLYTRFDTFSQVVMAYNAGEGNVKKWLNNKGEVFKETKVYLFKVKFAYNIYSLKNFS